MEKIFFCKRCVESNQRFVSSVQHKMKPDEIKNRALFDADGVCLSCKYFDYKDDINWVSREKDLRFILNKHRKNSKDFDVLIPGSGGKDSIVLADIIKNKYKMNVLTCTWSPAMYTPIGKKNYNSWIKSGFKNFFFKPNNRVHRILTKEAFLNLCHPFQPFALGQNNFAIKVAIKKNIKLIIYGDGLSEKAIGNINKDSLKKKNEGLNRWHYSIGNEEIFLGGLSISRLKKKYDLTDKDLEPYLPTSFEEIKKNNLEILHITDYINYHPQKNYYYAKRIKQFDVNPDGRTEGTYTKYQSLDDKMDGLHYYTWFIKTGRGRTTEDAALEIRNKIITRDEGKRLVKKFDGEFPKKYFRDCIRYMNISEKIFHKTIDKFRPKHVWKKIKKKWILRNAVWY